MPSKPQIAGTYRVDCGDSFYIGSTSRLASRRSDHRARLQRGTHPNRELQVAYCLAGTVQVTLIDPIPAKPGESKESHRARLRAAEQALLDFYQDNPRLANKSRNALGPDNDCLARKWKDPAFRAAAVARGKARRGFIVSAETRERMAAAKRGARNAKARPVVVTYADGKRARFDCLTSFARAEGVSQQVAFLWLTRGTSPTRAKYARLAGLRIAYEE